MISVLICGCLWWLSQNTDDKEIGNSNVLSMCSICAHYSIAWCSTITCSTLLYFSVYCCRSSNYWVVTVEGSGVFKHLNILMFLTICTACAQCIRAMIEWSQLKAVENWDLFQVQTLWPRTCSPRVNICNLQNSQVEEEQSCNKRFK